MRRWQYGWGLCRGIQPATEHDGVLDAVLALPRRYREWFALGDDPSHVRDLAKKAADAAKPTWLTVTTTHRSEELAEVLEEAGLELAAPGHRRRGLGTVVMAALATRAVERGARTGLLMATVEGGHLYRKLNWSPAATMLTATTRSSSALG